MPSASQNSRLRSSPPGHRGQLQALLVSVQADLAVLRAAVVASNTKQDTDIAAQRTAILAITAKLDADGGVTDTNYAATCNPAALTASPAPAALGTTA